MTLPIEQYQVLSIGADDASYNHLYGHNIMIKAYLFGLLACCLTSWATAASQLPDQRYYYRLTNDFLGTNRSLDVYNKGTHQPFMATTNTASGQYWQLTATNNGYYRLSNQYLGATSSLDTDAQGIPFMGTTGNYSGQFWQLTPLSNGTFRLSNSYLGSGRSLDTYSNANNDLFMGTTGNYSGQFWRLTPLKKIAGNDNVSQKYSYYTMNGFMVYVEKEALRLHNTETTAALSLLNTKLAEISHFNLKPTVISALKVIRIFMDWNIDNAGAMRYDPSKEWLIAHGQIPEKEKTVAVTNVRNFVAWSKLNQPYMVLHELAHGYHHQVLDWNNQSVIKAYNNAMTKKLYNNVLYNPGNNSSPYYRSAYATTNHMEYFSEMTEAFLGRNDFYPFTKSDLKKHDPTAYSLLATVWQPR